MVLYGQYYNNTSKHQVVKYLYTLNKKTKNIARNIVNIKNNTRQEFVINIDEIVW